MNSDATMGQDFTLNQMTLNFAPGEVHKTITLETIDDVEEENTENVTLLFSPDTEQVLIGDKSTHTLRIIDNDQKSTVILPNTLAQISENNQNYSLVVQLSDPSIQPVQVVFEVSGTADLKDYQNFNHSLIFSPGEVSKTMTLFTRDDKIYEGTESLKLEIVAVNGGTFGNNRTFQLDILDDENLPKFTLTQNINYQEDQAGIKNLILQLNPAFDKDVYFNVQSQGIASVDDISLSTNIVKFGPYQTLFVLLITLQDDLFFEGEESLNLAYSTSENISADSLLTQTITITDDENHPELYFESTIRTISETQDLNIALLLSDQLNESVEVSLICSFGCDNFSNNFPQSFVFEKGQSRIDVSLQTKDNHYYDQNRQAKLSLSVSNNKVLLGDKTNLNLTITDDEELTNISLSTNFLEIVEGASSKIQFFINPPSTQTIAFDLNASSAELTFNTSSITLSPLTSFIEVIVNIQDDDLVEVDEELSFSLKNISNAVYPNQDDIRVLVLDNDVPAVSFTSSKRSKTESSTQVNISLVLSSPAVVSSTVSIILSGSATLNEDYTFNSYHVTFQAGDTKKTLVFDIINDEIEEDSETITLILSSSDEMVFGSIDEFEYTILDDEKVIPKLASPFEMSAIKALITTGAQTDVDAALSSSLVIVNEHAYLAYQDTTNNDTLTIAKVRLSDFVVEDRYYDLTPDKVYGGASLAYSDGHLTIVYRDDFGGADFQIGEDGLSKNCAFKLTDLGTGTYPQIILGEKNEQGGQFGYVVYTDNSNDGRLSAFSFNGDCDAGPTLKGITPSKANFKHLITKNEHLYITFVDSSRGDTLAVAKVSPVATNSKKLYRSVIVQEITPHSVKENEISNAVSIGNNFFIAHNHKESSYGYTWRNPRLGLTEIVLDESGLSTKQHYLGNQYGIGTNLSMDIHDGRLYLAFNDSKINNQIRLVNIAKDKSNRYISINMNVDLPDSKPIGLKIDGDKGYLAYKSNGEVSLQEFRLGINYQPRIYRQTRSIYQKLAYRLKRYVPNLKDIDDYTITSVWQKSLTNNVQDFTFYTETNDRYLDITDNVHFGQYFRNITTVIDQNNIATDFVSNTVYLPPVISINQDSSLFTVSENDVSSDILIPITLSGVSQSEVRVNYHFNGSATETNDYIVTSSNPLIIPPGDTSTHYIKIKLLDDTVKEQTEQIGVYIYSPDVSYDWGSYRALIEIEDNELNSKAKFENYKNFYTRKLHLPLFAESLSNTIIDNNLYSVQKRLDTYVLSKINLDILQREKEIIIEGIASFTRYNDVSISSDHQIITVVHKISTGGLRIRHYDQDLNLMHQSEIQYPSNCIGKSKYVFKNDSLITACEISDQDLGPRLLIGRYENQSNFYGLYKSNIIHPAETDGTIHSYQPIIIKNMLIILSTSSNGIAQKAISHNISTLNLQTLMAINQNNWQGSTSNETTSNGADEYSQYKLDKRSLQSFGDNYLLSLPKVDKDGLHTINYEEWSIDTINGPVFISTKQLNLDVDKIYDKVTTVIFEDKWVSILRDQEVLGAKVQFDVYYKDTDAFDYTKRTIKSATNSNSYWFYSDILEYNGYMYLSAIGPNGWDIAKVNAETESTPIILAGGSATINQYQDYFPFYRANRFLYVSFLRSVDSDSIEEEKGITKRYQWLVSDDKQNWQKVQGDKYWGNYGRQYSFRPSSMFENKYLRCEVILWDGFEESIYYTTPVFILSLEAKPTIEFVNDSSTIIEGQNLNIQYQVTNKRVTITMFSNQI